MRLSTVTSVDDQRILFGASKWANWEHVANKGSKVFYVDVNISVRHSCSKLLPPNVVSRFPHVPS